MEGVTKNILGTNKFAELSWWGHVFWTNLGKIVLRKILKLTKSNKVAVWNSLKLKKKFLLLRKLRKMKELPVEYDNIVLEDSELAKLSIIINKIQH